MAATSLLRHSNVRTTASDYIKSVPVDALRDVEKMEAFFQKSRANSLPRRGLTGFNEAVDSRRFLFA
jgi:hypothetical protein